MYWLHSRKAAYYGLMLADLGTVLVFGWRIEETWALLFQHLEPWMLVLLRGFIFVIFSILGFVLSTHLRYGLEALLKRIHSSSIPGMDDERAKKKAAKRARWNVNLVIFFVLVNDFAAGLYLVVTVVNQTVFLDLLALVILCIVIAFPYLLGHWTLALAESLPAEAEERFLAYSQKKLINLQKQRLNRYVNQKLRMLRKAPIDDSIILETQQMLAVTGDGPYARGLKVLLENAQQLGAIQAAHQPIAQPVPAPALKAPAQPVPAPAAAQSEPESKRFPERAVPQGSEDLAVWTSLPEACQKLQVSESQLALMMDALEIEPVQDDYGQVVLSMVAINRLAQVARVVQKTQPAEPVQARGKKPGRASVSPLSLPALPEGKGSSGNHHRASVVEADPGDGAGSGPERNS